MKAKYLLALLFFCNHVSFAQNYQCLQSGVKPFYTNGNGYLRGMRIDSVRVSGGNTIYYPYHTPRGGYADMDSTGVSWLGKEVKEDTNGVFVFDDMWHDSVIIKTRASVGDSWTFFADTTNISYKATVTAIDTMSFLSYLDSVKTITIEADSGGSINPSDPINSFQIILSKNHGFVQVFDLCTFPYHNPGNVANGMIGVDYYLDLVLGTFICFCDMPGPYNNVTATNSIFHLIPFHNPTMKEVYNFSVGEVMASNNGSDYYGIHMVNTVAIDTILTKTITSSSVIYESSSTSSTSTSSCCPASYSTSYNHGVGSSSYDTTHLIDTTLMPEEWNNQYFYHFFPKANYDSVIMCPDTVCIVDINNINYADRNVVFETEEGGFAFIGNNTTAYSIGFGVCSFDYTNYAGAGYLQGSSCCSIIIGDTTCGVITPILSVKQPTNPANTLTIYPNPAHDELTIDAGSLLIEQVAITNLMGQCVQSAVYTSQSQVTVDLSGLPSGIYFVKINNTVVRKFVKE